MWDGPDLADVVALHRRADGVVVSPDVLQAHYERLCTAERELACRWRAWDDFGEVKDVDLARLADPACTRGDREACLVLAWAAPGTSVEDRVGQLEPLCAAGVMRACTDLGLVVWRDPVARPADLDRARTLHRDACAADVAIACRRAVEAGEVGLREQAVALGDPAYLPTADACEAGLVAACLAMVERAVGAERLALRERLCWMADAWCSALLADRAASPGTFLEGPVARVHWGDGAVLLGWETAAGWVDHARVELSRVTHATLHATAGRQEWLVLALDDGTEIVLPEGGCDALVSGAAALAAADRPARAVAADGGPSHSVCIDALGQGRGPRYRSGALSVVAADGEAGEIGPVREALVARSAELYTCAETSEVESVAPWRASFVGGRDGEVGRLKQTASSGDEGLDTCLRGWLAEADLGKRAVAVPFVVTIEIPY